METYMVCLLLLFTLYPAILFCYGFGRLFGWRAFRLW